MFKKIIKRTWVNLTPQAVKNEILGKFLNAEIVYSQEGEDVLLKRIFSGIQDGMYIDIGAHHPHRFSNTNLFYEMGWSGINVEPNPDLFANFVEARKRDVNINAGVGSVGKFKYYLFDEPALNTFSEQQVLQLKSKGIVPINIKVVDVKSVEMILEQHLPSGKSIEFMSIDVEGFEMEVLESNDWKRYRPKVIVIEDHRYSFSGQKTAITDFLEQANYLMFARTYNTSFFVASEFSLR